MSAADEAWQKWAANPDLDSTGKVEPTEEAFFKAGYRRAGDDLLPLLRVGPLFWKRVDVRRSTSECWEWQGSKERLGYGTVKFEPLAMTTAHRIAWALTNGRMPTGDEIVLHVCDNPPCCNPNHLRAGTQLDNVRDMIDKGRAEFQRPNCRRGHPRTPENTKYDRNGDKRCAECERIRQERYSQPWTCPDCGVALTMERHKSRHFKTQAHLRARAAVEDADR